MRRRHALAFSLLALGLSPLAPACSGPPAPRAAVPVEIVARSPLAPSSAEPAPGAAASLPLPAASPAAPTDAPPSELDEALLEAEAAAPIPAAPPKVASAGAAAVVWLPDSKGPFGFRSVLVVDARGSAQELARRAGPVLVGKGELWALGTRPLESAACDECEACQADPPACRQERRVVLAEPFLEGLESRRVLEPLRGRFSARDGCQAPIGDHDTTLSVLGGVGPVYFFEIHEWNQWCGGIHPQFADEPVAFDLDAGEVVTLSFPAAAAAALEQRAHAELARGCVLDPEERPAPYRALAAYRADGELEGHFQYTMGAPYVCGTGPGHYSALSEQRSEWLPPELAAYAKLPRWVATYLAKTGARHAFLLAKGRLTAARRQLRR